MSEFSWEFQAFDTKILGFKTAKILNASCGSVRKLLADLKKNKIQYATYRLPANNFPLIHALEKSGFVLVDGLLNFELKLSEVRILKTIPEIREARFSDLVKLKSLASGVFRVTRFYNDHLIPKEKADKLYAKWMENSLNTKVADLVLVWEEKGSIRGFITLQKKGHIPLVAVDKKERGKGIGKKLIHAALHKFKNWRVEAVAIETQLQNIPALRIYQSSGFKVINSHLTFRWFNDA